eukprot:1142665-Pelagomonas_calceolata.AAC.2
MSACWLLRKCACRLSVVVLFLTLSDHLVKPSCARGSKRANITVSNHTSTAAVGQLRLASLLVITRRRGELHRLASC